jgi:hypothetical protein
MRPSPGRRARISASARSAPRGGRSGLAGRAALIHAKLPALGRLRATRRRRWIICGWRCWGRHLSPPTTNRLELVRGQAGRWA